MAFAAIFVSQDRGGALFAGDQRRSLRFDNGQRVALGSLFAIAALIAVATGAILAFGPRAIITLPIITLPIITLTIFAGTVLTWTIIARPVVALAVFTRPLVARTFVTRPVVAGVALLTLLAVARTVVTPAVAITAAAFVAVVARAVVALSATLTLFTRAVVAGTIVAPTLTTGLLLLLRLAFGFVAFRVGLAGSLGLSHGRRLGAALVLEVDLEAAEVLAADDLGGGLGRLHGAHDAEIVLGVLQVALGKHPVARRRCVAGELLVLFENVLGVAAHLNAVGTVRIERPVRVLLLRLAATAAATIAAALALHTLEISHSLCPPPLRSRR